MPSFLRAAALVLCMVPLSVAQESPDPFLAERILQPDALLFLSLPQSATVSQDYAKSNLAKLVNHPEIQSFIDPLMKWWNKRRTQGAQVAGQVEPAWNEIVKQTIGLTIDDLWDLLHGPLSFAVYDLPIGPDHKPDVVLTLGAADAGGLEKAAVKVKEALKQQGGVTEGEYNRKGVTIREFGSDTFRVYYAAVQKTLVVASLQARLEKILDTAADPAAATLKNEAAFKAARARVSADNRHFFLLHLNLAQGLKQFRREIGDETLKVLDTLGISDITSIAAAMEYDGAFIRERYALMTAQQTRGIIKFLAGGSPEDPAARLVPGGALSYLHMGVNLAEMYDVLQAAAKVSPDFEQQMKQVFGEYETRVGFKIRDALATVGNSWSGWSTMPDGGGIFPDGLYTVTLADPAKFEDAVGKILKDAGLMLEEMSFRGQKLRYFYLGMDSFLPGLGGGADFIKFGYPIIYFIRDKRLFLSNNPLSLKRQIARFSPAAEPIAKDPRWAALASKVPQGGWESWSYTDLGRTLNIVYSALEPFSHIVRDLPRDPETGELIVDLARMPLGETLADLVGASLTAKRTVPDAILMDSWSNTGASMTSFTGYIAVAAAIAIPAMVRMQGGGAAGGVAQNEMMAEVSLQFMRQAQETFKNSDSDRNGAADFWTRDIAGLYALKDRSGQAIFLIDPGTAQADVDGAARYGMVASPKNGYFYKSMVTDPDGEAYQKDEDKDGNAYTNKSKYGLSAYPAIYPAAGRFTFITHETGKTWKKDTQGKPVDKWPGKDPSQDGWQPLD